MFYLSIKDKRLKKHLTQKQLAKKLHISQPYLSRLERNVRIKGVPLGLIDDLAKELGCSGEDILKWS